MVKMKPADRNYRIEIRSLIRRLATGLAGRERERERERERRRSLGIFQYSRYTRSNSKRAKCASGAMLFTR